LLDCDPVEHPRVTLPKNLLEALKRLEDAELETLLREVIAEAERRGVPKPVDTVALPPTPPGTKFRSRRSDTSGATADLPAGKVNLIKASHSAGMKPLAIARMFRVSLSVVNRVLNMPAKPPAEADQNFLFDQLHNTSRQRSPDGGLKWGIGARPLERLSVPISVAAAQFWRSCVSGLARARRDSDVKTHHRSPDGFSRTPTQANRRGASPLCSAPHPRLAANPGDSTRAV